MALVAFVDQSSDCADDRPAESSATLIAVNAPQLAVLIWSTDKKHVSLPLNLQEKWSASVEFSDQLNKVMGESGIASLATDALIESGGQKRKLAGDSTNSSNSKCMKGGAKDNPEAKVQSIAVAMSSADALALPETIASCVLQNFKPAGSTKLLLTVDGKLYLVNDSEEDITIEQGTILGGYRSGKWLIASVRPRIQNKRWKEVDEAKQFPGEKIQRYATAEEFKKNEN